NEVYEFSVGERAWHRLTEPYMPQEGDQERCVGSYDGGKTPVARHTYNGLAWVPTLRKMVLYAGGIACEQGKSRRDTWSFDPARAPEGADAAWALLQPQTDPPSGFGPIFWNPADKLLYLVTANNVLNFDFDRDEWVRISK